MPFYEYECESCGFADTLLEKFDAPALRRCPRCRKRAWRRLISPAAFHLKGGGWYATDFRNPPRKDGGKDDGKNGETSAAPSAEASAAKSPETSGGKSAESRPQAASAKKAPARAKAGGET